MSSAVRSTAGTQKPQRVHVTFGFSAAASLKVALETLGIAEDQLFLADDLSFGPIDPGDAHQRMQWAVDVLGFHEDPHRG